MMLAKDGVAHRGGRTANLLKVKTFHTEDAVVTGYEDGKGRHEGFIGALVCKGKTGATFKVGTGLKDAERQAPGAPTVGTVIEYGYFEMSKEGVPRFPTYKRKRPDMDAW